MFDAIAERYDLLNRLMSLGVDQSWRRQTVLALDLRQGARVLDLATGTGDLALMIALEDPGVSVVGLDPSERMLAIGRGKVHRACLTDRVELVAGDAQELPFDSDHFDGVSIAFGIRNVPDRGRALAEMARVTRPAGRVAVLELSEPDGSGLMGSLARLYVHTIVPRLGALISGAREYAYLQESIERFPPSADFADQMRDNGLCVLEVRSLCFGVCHLYVATPEARG